MTKKGDFEEYLEKYCQKHKISAAEAETHIIVQEYKKVCEERNAEKTGGQHGNQGTEN
jgi:hypothetical protein